VGSGARDLRGNECPRRRTNSTQPKPETVSTEYGATIFWGTLLDACVVDYLLSANGGIGPIYCPAGMDVENAPAYGYSPGSRNLNVAGDGGWHWLNEVAVEVFEELRKSAHTWPDALLKQFQAIWIPSFLKENPGDFDLFSDWAEDEGWATERCVDYDEHGNRIFGGYIVGHLVHTQWSRGGEPEEFDLADLEISRKERLALKRFLAKHDLPFEPPKHYLSLSVSY
jgi:hypothetical protein